MKNLDLREQVGQLMIMGFDGVVMSAKLRTTLHTLQPGGIILFARNIREPRQTWELLREARSTVPSPMFLCVDMEGGTVDRLRDVIAPAPSVADVVGAGNRPLFRKHGRIIGEECCTLGFNTDFAPVFDLALPASRPVLTSRTVSPDPHETVIYAREFLRGLRDAHVLGCGKHFPGLGEGKLDSHKHLPAIMKPWKQLWDEDLYPYRALHKQLPFVMIAHAAYPAVTRDRTPASLSRKWIGEILRRKVGYKGLIVTDDLDMGGVQAAAPIGEAAVQTIKAGADVFLVCQSEYSAWQAYEAVYLEAERDRRFARLVAEAAAHVMAAKRKLPALTRKVPAPGEQAMDRLRRQIWEISEELRLVKVAGANA